MAELCPFCSDERCQDNACQGYEASDKESMIFNVSPSANGISSGMPLCGAGREYEKRMDMLGISTWGPGTPTFIMKNTSYDHINKSLRGNADLEVAHYK